MLNVTNLNWLKARPDKDPVLSTQPQVIKEKYYKNPLYVQDNKY